MKMVSQDLSQQLDQILGSASQLLPELILILAGISLLVFELISKKGNWQSKTSISVFFVLLTVCMSIFSVRTGPLFGGILLSDNLSFVFEALFLFSFLVALVFPSQKMEIRKMGEYHFLLFTIVLGAFLMIKSTNLLIFYLSLETISISSYVLTSIGFKKKGFESGIKYLLFGALSSGVMLYGMSLLYGLSGSLDIAIIFAGQSNTSLHLIALFLLVVGILFKLSMVPMHIWAPDVYEAAPVSVVAIFSVIPKLASLIFLMRVTSLVADPSLQISLTKIVCWLAIASMFIGNLAAIWQTNAKRMMAYSSIAHAGFLIIGVVVNNDFGLQSVVFYSTIYMLMNMGTFYLIGCMERNGLDQIADYKGVGKLVPVIAIFMVIFMISLTGLPPTSGFTAKFLLFSALWSVYESSQQSIMFWLFIFGLINTVIALFYYLKIPYFSIFKPSQGETIPVFTLKDKLILGFISFLIVALFFKPDFLLDFTNKYNFGLSYLP